MATFIDTILFSVVIYNQKFKNTRVYKSLLIDVPNTNIFIWDNSCPIKYNSDIVSDYPNYNYSKTNVGVSYPYNRAADFARDNGYHWILLLDQDTYFPMNFLVNLEKSVAENHQIKLFCPVHKIENGKYLSPTRLYWKFSSPSFSLNTGILNLEDYSIINSGMLVAVDLFHLAGGYNPNVFLDYSDYQFLERVRKVSNLVCCINTVCLQDFSGICTDRCRLLARFSKYCLSVSAINDISFLDRIGYFLLVIKRTISLMIKIKSVRPLLIMFSKFL